MAKFVGFCSLIGYIGKGGLQTWEHMGTNWCQVDVLKSLLVYCHYFLNIFVLKDVQPNYVR